MKRIKILTVCFLIVPFVVFSALKCPKDTVQVIVYNTSPNKIKLQTTDQECKHFDIAVVEPNIDGTYCIKNQYLLTVSTMSLDGDTSLAITMFDLNDNVVITTPAEIAPDIDFQHGEVKVSKEDIAASKEKKIKETNLGQEKEKPPLPKEIEDNSTPEKSKEEKTVKVKSEDTQEKPPLPKEIEAKINEGKNQGEPVSQIKSEDTQEKPPLPKEIEAKINKGKNQGEPVSQIKSEDTQEKPPLPKEIEAKINKGKSNGEETTQIKLEETQEHNKENIKH